MPSTYPGNNILHPQIALPSDGDPAVSASVNVALMSLQDDAIYFSTELGFKIDTRGGNFSLTGDVNVIGAASRSFNVLTGIVQIGAGFISHINIEGGTTNVDGTNLNVNTTNSFLTSPTTYVGSGPSAQLNVNSAADFFAPVNLHADLTSGHTINATNLTADGSVDFDCDSQITHSGQLATVGGDLTVQGNTQLNGVLHVAANTHLGNSNTQSHLITGNVEMQQNLQVDGSVTINGVISIEGSGTSDLGNFARVGQLETFADTTIGNSSSDSLLINAQLTTPLVAKPNSAGRYVAKLSSPSLPPSNQALSILAATNFYCATSVFTGNVVYTLDTAGAQPGDVMTIRNTAGDGTFHATIQYTGGGSAVLAHSGDWVEVMFFDISGGEWLPWRGNVANT